MTENAWHQIDGASLAYTRELAPGWSLSIELTGNVEGVNVWQIYLFGMKAPEKTRGNSYQAQQGAEALARSLLRSLSARLDASEDDIGSIAKRIASRFTLVD